MAPPPRGSSDGAWQSASTNKKNKRKSGSHTAASAAATAATLSTSPTSPVAAPAQQNGSPTRAASNENEKTVHVANKDKEADEDEQDDGEWAIGQWIRLELAVSVQELAGGANGLPAAGAANGSAGNGGGAARAASPLAKVVEGRVFAYDKTNGFVVLQCISNDNPNAATKKFDLRIINTCTITSVSVPPASSNPAMDLIAVSAINWETSAHREAANIRIMETKLAKIGVGVGRDAQDLFDALSKTMECRWADSSIVVMDRVIISPPYRPENCKSNDQSALQRIKLVVQGERRKLKLGD